MNNKLRFAILFTFFVSIIMLSSCIFIYVLSDNFRNEDFYKRAQIEGLEYNDIIKDKKNTTKGYSLRLIEGLVQRNTLWGEEMAVLDSNGVVINNLPDTVGIKTFSKADLDYLRNGKIINERVGDRQMVIFYVDETKTFVIASGIDLPGSEKMKNLFFVLSTVFFGGLLITGFLSFFFVKEAFLPLERLSNQMRDTNIYNLKERVGEGNGKDEIAMIARSFNLMLERLEAAFENQKSFVQHASHELRTPLANMIAITENAINKKNMTVESHKQLLYSLREEQIELKDLTDSLLLLSQNERDQIIRGLPVVRVDELLYEAISEINQNIPDARIQIDFKSIPKSERELCVIGSESLLKTVFRNLLKNAIIYSSDAKADILISIDVERITIGFFNDGELLENMEQQQVFIPFFRGKNSSMVKGHGLGLTIVKRIVDIHGGRLSYRQELPNVNCFELVFKRA